MATKIVNNIPKPCTVSFEDIEVGQFFFDDDGDLCVRTDSNYSSVNAFCFEGNIYLDIGRREAVTPIHVTISIDGYGK